MRNKWITIAVVAAALAAFGTETAEAQKLAGTLEKLRAETQSGLPLGMLAGSGQTAQSDGGSAAGRTRGLVPGHTVRSGAPRDRTATRRNARGDGGGWDTGRAMSTLSCVGAVDRAVRTAKRRSSSRVYRAQSVVWSAQWAQRACGRVVRGR